MSPLFQFTVGLLASATGAAAIAYFFVADQVRGDPETFKIYRKTSFILALCSAFFFVLLGAS